MILDEGYFRNKVPLWPWSHGSWIYNYICNQCLSPLILWVQIAIRARCTASCDNVCQWLATGRWFSRGSPVSSTNETDNHDMTEMLLKVAVSFIGGANRSTWKKSLTCRKSPKTLSHNVVSSRTHDYIYYYYYKHFIPLNTFIRLLNIVYNHLFTQSI